MFGYVRPDLPYLYIKDEILYKAMYCGVCKGIGESCGQCARMGLSYDVTFLSVLLHNIAGVDVKIEKSHCLTHTVRKKPMAEVDELTRKLGAVNTELAYYKYTDDIKDGDKGKGKRLWFVTGHKRVKKEYPQITEIVERNLAMQEQTEKSMTDSVDRAADNTANMIAELSDYLLEDKKTPQTRALFYAIGKWIYLIDAIDDYDKDKKKGAYNPFVLAYGAGSRKKLVENNGADLEFIFNSLFYDIRENLRNIKLYFNRDLVDNVLLRGLPTMTKRIMAGQGCKADKDFRRHSRME
ncbi:MAG: hypothetical protein IKA72_03870 [Clostridia bacterium]|nr:hypothetical protein [Clostridia bacterium]